jgi:repressor LexA
MLLLQAKRGREQAMALTRRQKQVLDHIVHFIDRHGYSPSFEEIADGLKLTSLATVHKHLQTLEKKGFIRRGYNRSRSIEVTQLPRPVKEQVARHAVDLPLMGRIAAGQPVEAIENPETLSLGDFVRGGNVFVLEVKGDSMVDDHILEGDYIIVEQTENANNRDIVVALVGGDDATLKRFFREANGKVRLQPANSQMEPSVLPAKDVPIQGRVIGVLRRY